MLTPGKKVKSVQQKLVYLHILLWSLFGIQSALGSHTARQTLNLLSVLLLFTCWVFVTGPPRAAGVAVTLEPSEAERYSQPLRTPVPDTVADTVKATLSVVEEAVGKSVEELIVYHKVADEFSTFHNC